MTPYADSQVAGQQDRWSPSGRGVLYVVVVLVFALFGWAFVAHLDIVAVAPGKLIPRNYVQVVQPLEGGLLKDILVAEGQAVAAGEVLLRMDANVAEADRASLESELRLKSVQLRRVRAELEGRPFIKVSGDAPELYDQVAALYDAKRQTHLETVDAERAILAKAEQDLRAAAEMEAKLSQLQPIYEQQEQAWQQLARDGFAGKLMALDRQRSRIENERALKAQGYNVASLQALVEQSRKRLAAATSAYRGSLEGERVELQSAVHRLTQETRKLNHRHAALELKAPQAGIVKDLATHTPGTVVAAGTVLLTIVPRDEPLRAEVWVSNHDIGLVRPGQTVKIKLAAFPFQHYGMIRGVVQQVSADASDASTTRPGALPSTALHYRTLIEPDLTWAHRHALAPGMQLTAEIHAGERRVIQYLLSPLQKIVHEAGRER